MKWKATTAAIAASGCLLAATDAAAENWKPFFIVPNGVVLLDRDSLFISGGHVGARLESTFPQPQRISRNGRVFVYVKTIDAVDIDCAANVYKNVSRDLYGSEGLQALSLNESDNPMMISPGTAQAALVTAYCK